MAMQILLVDDDRFVTEGLRQALESTGRKVHVCTSPVGVVEDIEARRVDVVIAELEMTGLGGGEFLRLVRKRCPETVVVAYTMNPTAERAVEAMRLGVFDYRVKPVAMATLLEIVEKAEAHRVLLTPRPAPTPMPVPKVKVVDPGSPMTLDQAMEAPEREALLRALTRHAWNRQAAADELGINRTTLYKKMRKYGLDVGEIEPA